MKWTRYSLFYLAGYLAITGCAFLVAPRLSLELLLATRSYELTFVRFLGAFMIAVATLVIQMIRHRLEVLYPTTLAIRLMFLAVILWLYFDTRDRLFLMIFGVVVTGVALTAIGYAVERGHRHKTAPAP